MLTGCVANATDCQARSRRAGVDCPQKRQAFCHTEATFLAGSGAKSTKTSRPAAGGAASRARKAMVSPGASKGFCAVTTQL